VAFSTVFQAFLTSFLIDSGYKTPIQNIDELYESGIKLCYRPKFNFIFENGDEKEVSKVKRNRANCSSFEVSKGWAKYHKNVSFLFSDLNFEILRASGKILGENSEPFLCRLEDGVVYNEDLRMIMLQGDPLLRRVTEIINRIVESGIYKYWVSRKFKSLKFRFQKTPIDDAHDGYYSFNLYHMQPAFYLLLVGWCLSALCFMVELLYNRVLSKRM
jgi:hypothetical protein